MGKVTSLQEGKLLRRNATRADGAAISTIAHPIATTGELFADGSTIELIRSAQDGNARLMLWDGLREIVGSTVEHNGQRYEPALMNTSVIRELILPTHCRSHGNTREFLAMTCKLITSFAGLEEQSAALVGRNVLDSAVIDAVSVAPALMITGPDTARADRLVALLRCLCRHALSLTGVTPASLCSLPSGVRFTYLISQRWVSDKLWSLLGHASNRDRRIPSRGRLLDLFGLQVIHCDSVLAEESRERRLIQISMIPTGRELPHFDSEIQHQIMSEFQAKLLSFRRANLGVASSMQFDASRFPLALQDLARSLATSTPDDTQSQSELFNLLEEKRGEIQSEKWIDLDCVALAAIIVAGNESREAVYVGELAEIGERILTGRGENEAEIDSGALGKRIKRLGFQTEPRDAKGMKLRLTAAILNRARLLISTLGCPGVGGSGKQGREL